MKQLVLIIYAVLNASLCYGQLTIFAQAGVAVPAYLRYRNTFGTASSTIELGISLNIQNSLSPAVSYRAMITTLPLLTDYSDRATLLALSQALIVTLNMNLYNNNYRNILLTGGFGIGVNHIKPDSDPVSIRNQLSPPSFAVFEDNTPRWNPEADLQIKMVKTLQRHEHWHFGVAGTLAFTYVLKARPASKVTINNTSYTASIHGLMVAPVISAYAAFSL